MGELYSPHHVIIRNDVREGKIQSMDRRRRINERLRRGVNRCHLRHSAEVHGPSIYPCDNAFIPYRSGNVAVVHDLKRSHRSGCALKAYVVTTFPWKWSEEVGPVGRIVIRFW